MKTITSFLTSSARKLFRKRTVRMLAAVPFLGTFLAASAQTISVPTTSPSLSFTACAGSPVTVSFTTTGSFNGGNTFQVQLSTVSGSFGTGTVIIGSGSASPISAVIPITTGAGAGYRIRVVSTSPAVNGSGTTSGQITIRSKPSSPTTTAGNRCGTGSVNLSASGCTTTRWYDAQTGGTLLGSTAAFATPSISSSTTYYAACVDGNGCESIRTSALATVNPLPVVSSFTPSSGTIDVDNVDISGANFTNVDSVKFNGVAATTYTVNSPSSITALVPIGATTGKIKVVTSCGSGSSATNFTPIKPSIATPVFSQPAGSYESGIFVTITCATEGASIYYTTNGNSPVVGTVYTKLYQDEAIFIPSTSTLRAIGYRNGWTTSGVAAAAYTITNPTVVAKPVITPVSGSYTGGQLVTITCSTPESVIYFTLNGQIPVPFVNTPIRYRGPFSVINPQVTVRAIGTRTDWADSDVAAAFFTITGGSTLSACTFNPPPGGFGSPVSVTITNADPSASIYYTRDGTDPYKLLPLAKPYTGPVALNASSTLKAQAFRDGFGDSPRTTGIYTIAGLRQAVDNGQNQSGYFTEETSIYGLGSEVFNAVKEIASSQDLIQVYPNPSNGQVYVDFGVARENVTLQVVDLVGKIVQTSTVTESSFGAALNLEGNKAGFYIIRLSDTKGNRLEKRIVLQ